MNAEEENLSIIRLPRKRSRSLIKFCQRVRLARGNICENCGATAATTQIESHHILDYHEYPDFAKDEANIIILCQPCHSGLSSRDGDLVGYIALRYACFKRELRLRIAAYIEEKDPLRSELVRIIRAGREAAVDYHFKRIEM